METSKAYIYECTPIDELVKFEQRLPYILFDLPKNKVFSFSISSTSGWLSYLNHDELYNNNQCYLLPKSALEVKKVVKDFLLRCNERLINENRTNLNFKLTKLFPRDLSNPEIIPVYLTESEYMDHWIVKFRPKLRLESGFKARKVNVIGSSFNIRIGNGGKVIGLESNWRPISRRIQDDIVERNINIEGLTEGHHHSVRHQTESSDFTIAYFDKGDTTHYNFLCPYYVDVNGHHFKLLPACKSSLVVDIIEDHNSETVDLYADVVGGSGRFDYHWASWSIEDMENSFEDRGDSSLITLGVGAYTISLVVIDRVTKVVDQKQLNIFVHLKDEENQPLIA